MAFCFDVRGDAAKRLAERGGVNYRHQFIERCDDGQFALYFSNEPVPDYQFKTVDTADEAFDFLEKLERGELGYVTKDRDGNWEVRPDDETPQKALDQPLAWGTYDRYEAVADDGVGLYCITKHTSFWFRTGYSVVYRSPFWRDLYVMNMHHWHWMPGMTLPTLPRDDYGPRLKTLAAAKAACERHHAMGRWD